MGKQKAWTLKFPSLLLLGVIYTNFLCVKVNKTFKIYLKDTPTSFYK